MRANRVGAAFTAFAVTVAAVVGAGSSAAAAEKKHASSATSPIVGAGDPNAVAGEYIVVLNGATGSQVAADATSLTAQYGGTVGDEYTDVLQGFSMAATAAQATAMTASTLVSYIEQDATASASGLQVLPPATGSGPAPLWNLDRIDQRSNTPQNLYSYRNTASSVTAYVIDTGILITNTDFQGRASYGFNALAPGTAATDCNGHGTHVAGTLGGATYGVAKSVKLVAVKVLDCSGNGDIQSILDGIDWVAKNAVSPAVVNMSIETNGAYPALDTAATALSKSRTVIVSAGNKTLDAGTVSPSEAPGPIVVGATDSTDTQASFSNFGSRVDIYAPGVNILSDDWTSNTATSTKSGTSMAAPAVAGAAAMLLQDSPGLNPAQIKTDLVQNATTGKPGAPLIQSLGAGSPDRLLYVAPPSVPLTVGGAAASQTIGTGASGFDFTFAGTAGQTVYINGTAGSFDASITLYDPHGSNLGAGNHYSYDSGTAESWISPVNLPLTGTYTLHIVPAASATGTLSAQVLTYATASATVGGAAVSATIPAASPGQRLAVTFLGTVGQRVYVNGTAGGYNATISLLDPHGMQMASGEHWSYDSGIAEQWIAPVNLPYTGTYTIEISPDANATGSVSLQVLTTATASATVGGAAVSATIPAASPGERLAVTFAGTVGQTVYVNGTAGGYNATITVLDPHGMQVASGQHLSYLSGTAEQWIAPVNLPYTGTYTIEINPDANATGSVSLQVIGSFVTASAGVNGLPAALDIPSSTPGKIMAITFSGTAGSAISVLGITGPVGGSLAMYDPDGAQTATGTAIPDYPCPGDEVPGTCPQVLIAPVTIPLTGTYTIYFTPAASDVGPVTVSVTSVGGTAPTINVIKASAVINGAAVPVTVPTAAAGQRMAVTFQGAVGQDVYVNGNCGSSCNAMNTTYSYVSLVGPSGQLVVPSGGGFDLGSPLMLLDSTGLPVAGTYTLYITLASGLSGTLDVQMFSGFPATSATVDGAAVPVTVPSTSQGRRAAVTFTGAAGQAVYVISNCSGNSCNGLNTTYSNVSLIGPSGQLVVPMDSGLDPGGPLTVLAPTGLPVAGTYTLYITTAPNLYGTMNLQVMSKSVSASATVGGAAVPVTVPSTSVGQHVAVTFTGTAGQAVYVANTCTSCSSLNTTYSYVSLVGPSGQLVVPMGGGLDPAASVALLNPTGLPATGTYTLYFTPAPDLYGTMDIQVYSYS